MPADYRTPSPDDGHEAIRAPLAQAIDDLAAASNGVGDAYMFTDMLFELIGAEMTARANLEARISDLESRNQ